MCLPKYLVNKTGPKNTVENMKHLKVQHLSESPKKYDSYDQYPKEYRFSEFKAQKYVPLIPVCKYAKSTPGGRAGFGPDSHS